MSRASPFPVFLIAAPGALRNRLAEALLEARTAGPEEDLEALLQGSDGATCIVHAWPGPRFDSAAVSRLGAVLETVVSHQPRHLILISSAAVHAPSHHHAGLVSEERWSKPRWPNAVAVAWLAVEEAARRAVAGSSVRLTVLRPAPVAVAGEADLFSRLLGRRIAVLPAGYDPNLQLLAAEDLARAVCTAVERGRDDAFKDGVFNLAPLATVPLRRAVRYAGGRTLPLPTFLLAGWRRLGALFGRPAPAAELDYLRYPFTVSDAAARQELDWQPGSSSAEVAQTLHRKSAAPEGLPEYDDFGLDEPYVDRLSKVFFPFLHDRWWRIEVAGLGNVPRQGRAVVVGVHRGHQPWDGVMLFYLLRRELRRHLRFLIHPTLVKFPFLAPYMIKCGGVHACRENAAWVLERDELLGIFPEGIRGAFTPYRKAYQLGRFGRDEFVKIALLNRAPLVPVVTVGSAEIFPILGRIDWSWFKRFTEWPYLPITPTMGTVPLPSKWHTCFLEPIHVEREYGPEAAADPEIVKAISQDVRRRLETAIAEMLRRRKSIFWGSIFEGPFPAPAKTEAT